jgi:hypothetical protein
MDVLGHGPSPGAVADLASMEPPLLPWRPID